MESNTTKYLRGYLKKGILRKGESLEESYRKCIHVKRAKVYRENLATFSIHKQTKLYPNYH